MRFVQALHATVAEGAQLPEVRAPSFSHAEKDPVAGAIAITPQHTIVLVEGLYCNVNVEPWRAAAALWDMRLFLDVSTDVARARLGVRHVAAQLARTEAEALDRGTVESLAVLTLSGQQ